MGGKSYCKGWSKVVVQKAWKAVDFMVLLGKKKQETETKTKEK